MNTLEEILVVTTCVSMIDSCVYQNPDSRYNQTQLITDVVAKHDTVLQQKSLAKTFQNAIYTTP